MDVINKLSKDLTIVMIARKLSTVEYDRVVRIDQGRVVDSGPPKNIEIRLVFYKIQLII